ncbi:hydrolase [Legionella fairfieldensis]|uniref:hydrolase n=1 Tax=Legionella fairfieldensis TaxID=45064 RepID=UPI00048E2AA6|nr:hydrolase [Legionella fairfieldensis]
MDPSIQELLFSLDHHKHTMVEQLHQFCEINSGTENLAGLARLKQVLIEAFTPVADDIQIKSLPPVPTMNMHGDTLFQHCGEALFIRKRPALKRRILLCGHMDTVYDVNHPFQTLNYINDNCINGPGVADMKGGLIVLLHALSNFENTPFAKELGWDVFINPDEEIGSPASGSILNTIAPYYKTALVYEPAMTAQGAFAKNRRGSGKLTLIATGKASHVGRAFNEGRNAICYLAEAITTIHALNQHNNGITINVGKIAGGEALNMVPDKAVAQMDIRITNPEDEHWVKQQLNHIIQNMAREGYNLTVHGQFGRPVKRISLATERLFKRIQQAGNQLGLTLDWQDSGGCCDGNNLAHSGLAVIDTLGVRGGDIHSSNEFILLDSLIERVALSTLLLVDLAQGGLEELTS